MSENFPMFQFFDKDFVKIDGSQNIPSLQGLTMTAVTGCRGFLIFGDSNGCLHICDRNFTFRHVQQYNGAVTHLVPAPEANMYLSVGLDATGQGTLHVWSLMKWEILSENDPQPIRAISLPATTTLTALTTCPDLSATALGYSSGLVRVYRANLARDRWSKPKELITPNEDSSPVQALFFDLDRAGIFCVFRNQVMSVILGKKKTNVVPLGDFGSTAALTCLNERNELLVGQTSEDVKRKKHLCEIVAFGLFERRGTHPEEKEVTHIFNFRSYLGIAGNGWILLLSFSDKSSLKYVALQARDLPQISHIFTEWGLLFCLTTDGRLLSFEERDTHSKLEILFRRSSFDSALELSRTLGDTALQIEIYKRYGDYLYQNREFERSMDQYIHTVGHLEPSYVIKQFLEAQMTDHLKRYLETLHEKKLATRDHTTLLLSCYTKEGRGDLIEEFIDKGASFDTETAISVCRNRGYIGQAKRLALKSKAHRSVLKILIEDSQQYSEAIHYIQQLRNEDAKTNLLLYGQHLLEHVPETTTEVLVAVCVDEEVCSPRVEAREFVHLFVGKPKLLMRFLQVVIDSQDCVVSQSCYNTLLELYLLNQVGDQAIMDFLTSYKGKYDLYSALTLIKEANFGQGLFFLLRELGLNSAALDYLIDSKATADDVAKLAAEQNDESLWCKALLHYAESSELPRFLGLVTEMSCLSPLTVISVLSKTNVCFSAVKDFVTYRLYDEASAEKADRAVIEAHRKETHDMRSEMEKLRKEGKVFQLSYCVAPSCKKELSLPATHFLCGHSFHTHCLSDENDRCPVCSESVSDFLREREKLRAEFSEIPEDKIDFATVARMFGNGGFDG